MRLIDFHGSTVAIPRTVLCAASRLLAPSKQPFCCIALLAMTTGCGRSEPSLADYNDNNLKKLRGAYGMFQVAHNLRGPGDEEELKEFLTSNPGALRKMEILGVPKGKVLDIFVSERDGQPFKIRYGLTGLGDYPIVFESVGVDGKRMVAYTTPRELDVAEYDAAWAGEIKANSGINNLGATGNSK